MKKLFLFAFMAGFFVSAFSENIPEEDQELIKSLRGVYRSMPETDPARYAIELIAGRFWHSVDFARLMRKIPSTPQELAESRARLQTIRSEMEKGKKWKLSPPRFTIPKLKNPPVIDGEVSADEWQGALNLTSFYPIDSETADRTVSGIWHIGYHEKNLYFSAEFPEKALKTYRFHEKGDGRQPWDGDAVEMFILPDRRLMCYREIVCNAEGTMLSCLHTKSRNEIYINANPEPTAPILCKSKEQNGIWSIEIAIPFSELPGYFRGNAPKSGETLHFALIRTKNGVFYSVFPLLYGGHNIYGYSTGTLE